MGFNRSADIEARKIGDNRTLGPVLEAVGVPANSDFHPFVDLNAPRLRYLRDNAMELPALTVLPIPFLELIGVTRARRHTRALGRERRDPRPSRAKGSRHPPRTDERRPRRTGSGHGAIAGAHRHRGGSLRTAAGEIRMAGCRQEDQRRNRGLSHPGRAAERLGLGSDRAPVIATARATDNAWVDLWAAIARRDEPAIAGLGEGAARAAISRFERRARVSHHRHRGRGCGHGAERRAQALLRSQWGRFDHAGQFDFALRELGR